MQWIESTAGDYEDKMIILFFLSLFFSFITHNAWCDQLELISKNRDGRAASGYSFDLSENNRLVVFSSTSSEIVEGDTNKYRPYYEFSDLASDVFLYDRQTKAIKRISLNPDGTQIENNPSFDPTIDDTGKRVPFVSGGELDASILLSQDDQPTRILSLNEHGEKGNWESYFPAISANGLFVAYITAATNITNHRYSGGRYNVIRKNLITDQSELVSLSYDGQSAAQGCPPYPASISGDGRYVGFLSKSNLLIDGISIEGNNMYGIFIRDMQTKAIEHIATSVYSEIYALNFQVELSGDGRYVVFTSNRDLVPNPPPHKYNIYIYDRWEKKYEVVPLSTIEGKDRREGLCAFAISSNGRYIVFASGHEILEKSFYTMEWQPNALYRYDRQTGETIHLLTVDQDMINP